MLWEARELLIAAMDGRELLTNMTADVLRVFAQAPIDAWIGEGRGPAEYAAARDDELARAQGGVRQGARREARRNRRDALRAAVRGSAQGWAAERRAELLVRYLGFPYWDVLLFPLQSVADAGERDTIEVVRMSPRDAKLLPPLDPSKPKELAGFETMHFGAFFDRAGRENDYLWGRLDGAERLIGLVLGAAFTDDERADWCRKAFAAIARRRTEHSETQSRSSSTCATSHVGSHTSAIVSLRASDRRAKQAPFGQAWLRADLERLVESFEVSDDQRHFISSRWLENVLWMEAAAQRTRTRYYGLRLTTIVGAVIVPALVSINAVGGTQDAITWLTFAVSLVVALSAAVEGFFRFGDRWRHYRSLVEELKSEGWGFYELSGSYRGEGAKHKTAFPTFVERVNELLARETQTFIAEIAHPAPAGATADSPEG